MATSILQGAARFHLSRPLRRLPSYINYDSTVYWCEIFTRKRYQQDSFRDAKDSVVHKSQSSPINHNIKLWCCKLWCWYMGDCKSTFATVHVVESLSLLVIKRDARVIVIVAFLVFFSKLDRLNQWTLKNRRERKTERDTEAGIRQNLFSKRKTKNIKI